MQKLNRPLYWEKIKLQAQDYQWAFAITLTLALFVVLPQLFKAFDAYGAQQEALGHVSAEINRVLLWLDDLSFTDTAVTFIFWSVVGLFSYSVVGAVLRIKQRLDFDNALLDGDYVHPATLTKRQLMQYEVINTLMSITTGMVAMGALFVMLGLTVPALGVYTRMLGLCADFASGAYCVAMLILLYASVVVLIFSAKAFQYRGTLLEQ